MAEFDLDAARAARLEKKQAEGAGKQHSFTFEGKKYTLPVELPWSSALKWGDPDEFISSLLGDQAEAFMAAAPSTDDVLLLVDETSKLYGFASPGESGASSPSSSSNGKASKPTSKGSTKSTSDKRSGGAKASV